MNSKAAKQRVIPVTEKLTAKYGCGPVHFSGTDEALYERHLLFDSGVDLAAATARDRFEALARSVRDVLSQRWLLTEKTYEETESQAALLPLDGVSHRPLARKQRCESSARSTHRPVHPGQETESARDLGAGARCRPGKRRSWTFGRMLH